MLNNDYKDMLSALREEKVKFLLVGAYAMAAQGYPRATMDIDIWIIASAENISAVMKALKRFGAPMHNISAEDFKSDDFVFQIGVAPRRIDILTSIDGLDFVTAFKNSCVVEVDGIAVNVLSKEDLIINKRASGRTKDLADVEELEKN
ncbi:MAG: nucleotidyltransferase [Elusimicrobiota bacterium]|jgi:predicted nucleotidyltransferase|nr:nucleotidyltransferase [Elusimicrobiota bacterium]